MLDSINTFFYKFLEICFNIAYNWALLWVVLCLLWVLIISIAFMWWKKAVLFYIAIASYFIFGYYIAMFIMKVFKDYFSYEINMGLVFIISVGILYWITNWLEILWSKIKHKKKS